MTREKIALLQEELLGLHLAAGHLGYSLERCQLFQMVAGWRLEKLLAHGDRQLGQLAPCHLPNVGKPSGFSGFNAGTNALSLSSRTATAALQAVACSGRSHPVTIELSSAKLISRGPLVTV